MRQELCLYRDWHSRRPGFAGAFYAGIAYAADPRFDEAISNCTKAIALLKAATNSGRRMTMDSTDTAVPRSKSSRTQSVTSKRRAFDDKTPPPPAASAK